MENTVLELTAKIKQLEQELKKLKDNNGYGLTREEKAEEFEEQAKNALPIVQEDQSMRIENDHHLDHLIIQGDNFHSLSALNYTHRGLIDVIYIDPPYNTGNKDFSYNDSFIDKDEPFRHSKRLSYISKRLKLAKKLLSDKGIFFISIDDNELSQLKLLCDSIFGEKNFVACLPTIMNLKGNQDEFGFAGTHEYTLVYSNNKINTIFGKFPILDENSLDEWTEDEFGLYKIGTLKGGGVNGSRIKRPNLYFPIFIKRNGKVYVQDSDIPEEENDFILYPISEEKEMTWRRSKSKIQKESHNIFINFNKDGKPNIFRKIRPGLGDVPSIKPKSIFYKPEYSSGNGTNLLKNIFGKERMFSNPKPLQLIYDLLQISSQKTSIILDFFAGSGTTGHAVLELNKEDGGERKFILCSNRENTKEQPDKNICKDITYERVKRVMTGYHNSKGEQVAGLGGGNLRYYTTQFIQTTASTDDLRYRFIHLCDDLLCIKEDTFTPIDTQSHSQYLKIFQKNKRYTVVLYDIHHFDELSEIVKNLNGEISVYIFSLSKEIYEEELLYLNQKVKVQNIPDDILQTYKKIFKF